jgi:uncharacterized protein YciI
MEAELIRNRTFPALIHMYSILLHTMKKLFSVFLIAICIGFSITISASAQSKETKPAEAKQPTFIYVLRLLPEYQKEANWTPEAQKVVGTHFNHLKQLTKDGVVVLGGRTDYGVDNSNTFGIVVFYAKDLEAARALMESDPAVKGKVMTAEVHPFALALIKGQKFE